MSILLQIRNTITVILSVVFVLAGTTTAASAQGTNPTRPIRIVVASAPSSGADIVARLIAQGLTEKLARPVVVENRSGAGGIIGYETVAKAPADGYTMLLSSPSLATNPATYKTLPYDAMRDFTPITQLVQTPNILVVHPSVPAKTVKEMIALAKLHPGEILYASSGQGTGPHLTMELFCLMTQTRMTHVPYKGSTPGIIDLVAGQIWIMAPSVISVMSQIRSNKLRALGVTSASRISVAPEIPTVAETGVPGYEAVVWFGLLVPTGTPRDIVARLYKEATTVLRSPNIKERITADGAEVVASSSEQFAAFIHAETAKWSKVAKAAGLAPQ